MTLQEIGERLKREFPDRYVKFAVTAEAGRRGHVEVGCEISWESDAAEMRTLRCWGVEQGIYRLHECLGTQPNEPFTIEMR